MLVHFLVTQELRIPTLNLESINTDVTHFDPTHPHALDFPITERTILPNTINPDRMLVRNNVSDVANDLDRFVQWDKRELEVWGKRDAEHVDSDMPPAVARLVINPVRESYNFQMNI